MTVEMFATELNRFLASDEPEVLCIVGRWGVGKTYAWKHYFSEAQKNKSVKLRKYAYISLFGRNSLDDVRTSIVENTVDSDVVGQQPDLKSFDSIVSRFLSNAKDVTKIAGYIPQASGYAASANRALYLMVSQQIICIDDLERAGNGLDVRNIMGLVSSLKEEKKCKAVILLNEEALEGEKKTDFHAHLEKIADTVIRFDPTAKEAAAIGVTKDQKYTDDLTKAVQDLAIVNIRVIKKIERFCRRAFELIGEHDPRLMQQTVQALALACYAKYQPGEAPSLGFIRNYNSMSDLIGVDPNKPRSDQKHRDILRNYGFSHMDEYDSIIFDAVERGYFSEDELKNQADKLEQELKKRDKHDSFFGAWEDFHSSFEADQDAVLDRMYESVKSDYEVISPTDLSGTVGLFKELGRPEQAQEIIKIYIENRKDDPSFWDLSASGLGGHVTDQDVRSAFADKHAATRRQFDPEKFIRELPSRSGWNPEDVAEMAKVNEETLASIFKSLKRDEFKNAVNGALYFKNVSNKDSNMAKIVETAEKALRRIASESPINAMRVKSFGVTLDEPT